MRFPSVALLAERAVAVLRRFPWTLAAGAVAAAAAIIGSTTGADDAWGRAAFVAALALPVTVALSLVAEARRWPPVARAGAVIAALAGLAAFFAVWRGMDVKHEAIRYLQLSAALHLAVAFLPFLGARESVAFWQYNRRLFLGFLRAVVFSGVLFAGVAVALGALDKLFGVDIDDQTYLHIWFVAALVVNTWIFLAAVPEDLPALERDTEYPRGLKVFAQYILTPLAFTYLVLLLAYLVKIVAGGEWPSGWIGWLVASVSVTGLLGWLLVHPLRADPDEGWIRTYARWLFIGLVPAAVMLLVAFWKRILPYGLTEPRVLGLVLGLWLLGIALLFTVRSAASIRTIPVTLSLLLLLTAFGPLGLSRVSVKSQGKRFAAMLAADGSRKSAAEASAALRFLLDHRAAEEIAARAGRPLPPIDWGSVPRHGDARDSVAARIMAVTGVAYVPEYAYAGGRDWFSFHGGDRSAIAVTGFDWSVPVVAGDSSVRVAGVDSIGVLLGGDQGVARIRVGADTLTFDLRPIARTYADSGAWRGVGPAGALRVEPLAGRRRAVLVLGGVGGQRAADSLEIKHWNGSILLAREGGGPPAEPDRPPPTSGRSPGGVTR